MFGVKKFGLSILRVTVRGLDLLSFDVFTTHLTDGVKAQLLESNSDILPIPASYTSTCQPMDVSLKDKLKAFDDFENKQQKRMK